MENRKDYCRCLYYSANALSSAITKMAEEAFADTGLPPSYAFLVMSINKYPGIPAGELAELQMLTPSTITRLVEKLEKKGLARRVNEGRSTLVFPTPASVALSEKIKAAWSGLYRKYAAILGDEEARSLTSRIYDAALALEE